MIFEIFLSKIKISYKLTKIEIFEKHRDFLKKKNSKFFREFRTDLRFFIKFQKDRDFSSIVRKTHNFQQIQDYKKNDKNR